VVASLSPVGVIAGPIFGITQPFVAPFAEIVPPVRVLGGVLETYTLVAILAVYLIAGLLGQAFLRR
jgi:uncharacterized protein YggT (Ycf19 family)